MAGDKIDRGATRQKPSPDPVQAILMRLEKKLEECSLNFELVAPKSRALCSACDSSRVENDCAHAQRLVVVRRKSDTVFSKVFVVGFADLFSSDAPFHHHYKQHLIPFGFCFSTLCTLS